MTAREILQAIAFLLILSTPVFFEAFPVPCFIAVGIAAVLTVISNIERRIGSTVKVDRRVYKR